MSTDASAGPAAASGPPDEQQALQEEIERTREHLGQTVEALVAKADVKARAQGEASRLIGRLKGKAAQGRHRAATQAGQVRGQVAGKTAGPRQQAAAIGGQAGDQARQTATAAAAGISKVTPEPVKSAAGKAAGAVRRHQLPVAGIVGAVIASVLALLLIRRRRQG